MRKYLVELSTQGLIFEVVGRHVQVNERVNHQHKDWQFIIVMAQGNYVEVLAIS